MAEVCTSCDKKLKSDETVRVVTTAYVTENTTDSFDYERKTDEAVICSRCDYLLERGK